MKRISFIEMIGAWDARIGREDYALYGLLPAMAMTAGAYVLAGGSDVAATLDSMKFMAGAGIAGAYLMAVSVKRLHDLNMPGWLAVLPLFAWVVAGTLEPLGISHSMADDFGQKVGMAVLLLLAFFKGGRGNGLYGPPVRISLVGATPSPRNP